MAITRCEVADVAVLLGNNDFRIYQVKRDLELEDLLLMHAQKFWSDHVLSMSPPNPITTQDAAVLFPKNRPGSEVEANAQIYQTLEQFREKLSHASALNTECERLKTEILTYMGHSERLSFGGKTLATWKCTNPSQRIDTKALAADVGQRKILNANVAVGLGVDGSASNDAAHMLNEARQAMLLARVSKGMQSFGCDTGPSEMTPRQALHLATRGGAQVLGRARDVGQITVGYCADIAMFRTDTLAMAGGAVHDPVGALMLCASSNADYTIVNGKVVVDQGHLSTVDLQPLIEKHNNYAKQLALGAF
ncbi:MAG: amidohydrolase family protein [Burkholderiaceae bacterium]